MSPPPRRRRWPKPFARATALIGGLLALIVVGIWWGLPVLVRKGFARGAAAAGFQEASIRVDRADLTGLRATEIKLRRSGLEISLDHGSADYSILKLVGGRVARVVIDGLSVTLDLTQPQRGLLPDAVADLAAQFGGSDEPLVWPVDELTLKDCQLILILPGGPQTFVLSGSAARQRDGLIGFTLRSDHPEQNIEVSGNVRTETMDGDITLNRLSVQPGFILGVARQLGLFSMPANVSVTAGRVAISGAATLKAGVPENYSAQLNAPLARASVDQTTIALDNLDVSFAQGADHRPTAKLNATLHASDSSAAWDVGPVSVQSTLDAGAIHASADAFSFAYAETAKGRATLQIDSGVPQLGGRGAATLVLGLSDLEAAGVKFAPLEIRAEGWLDRLVIMAPEISLASGGPVALRDFHTTITDPLGPGRALEGAAQVHALAEISSILPAGWTLAEPELPLAAAQLDFEGTFTGGVPAATLVVRSKVPRVRLLSGESVYAGAPAFEATVQADGSGASLAALLDVGELELRSPLALPGANALTATVEIPRTSYVALAAAATGRASEEDLAVTIKASLAKSALHGSAAVSVRRSAAAKTWSAIATASLGGVNGKFLGMDVTELVGEVSADSGAIADEQVAAWLQTVEPASLARTLAPQIELHASLTAAALERAGVARAEWAGVWLTKSRAAAGAPPLAGSLTLNAGIVRSGPETMEQPTVELAFGGDLATQDLSAKASALLEGTPLKFTAQQHLVRADQGPAIKGEGTFALEPFTLANSDVVSRWVPAMRGLAISGTVAARGAVQYASDGTWDGSVAVNLTKGVVNYPVQKLRGEGVTADIEIQSLAAMRTAPGQRVGIARLLFGDIVARDVVAHFRTASSSVVHIEDVSLGVFDGVITAEPFSLYFPDPDVALDLRMQELDANQLVRTFDLFGGTLTGRLRGRLPIGLLAGRPIIGEGFLELEENHPATFSFDTGGLFTSGLPDRTIVEQLNRQPYELLEDGLKNLQLQRFRIDLFRRDRPGTPVEMVFGGTAHTRRADVPITIDVHVNGSMAELIDRVLQLIMM